MKRFLRENGLSLALFGLFFVTFLGQIGAGFMQYNQDQQEHGEPEVGLGEYLKTGHFIEATFENWESEFLQMSAYTIFTVFLYQKGSAESKSLSKDNKVDEDPRTKQSDPHAPWAVRRGGWVLKVYEYSLTVTLLTLFLVSFVLHALGGAREFNQQQLTHGEQPISTLRFLVSAPFWFQSFQNWQSEFLSIGAMVVLSIYLRQRGSAESKPVAMPHHETDTK